MLAHPDLRVRTILRSCACSRIVCASMLRCRAGPGAIAPILRELESEGALTAKDTQFHGFPKKEYQALTEPHMSGFTPKELALAEAAIKIVCEENTANSMQ